MELPKTTIDGKIRWEIPLLSAFVVGLLLRLHQFHDQVFADDEWHSMLIAVFKDYPTILTQFSSSGSIPLEVLYKFVHDNYLLSETIMRLPMLVGGLITIIVLPLLVRSYIGRNASNVFAFLLAISPLLVYYSRYARPYGISLLLTFVGIIAFYRWWTGGPNRWVWLFGLCAVLGTYSHLTTAPAFVAPFVYAFGDICWRRLHRQEHRPVGQLFVVGTNLLLLWLITLGPPLLLDWSSIAKRAGSKTIMWQTLSESFSLLTGTANSVVLIGSAVLIVAGSILFVRRQPKLAIYLLMIIAWVEIALVLSRASSIHAPIVFVRYTLFLLPLMLMMIAVELTEISDFLRSKIRFLPAGVIAAVWCVGAFAFGPLLPLMSAPNNWTNHALYQYSYDPDGPFSYHPDRRPLRISEFYRTIGEQPAGSLSLVEAPWFYEWHNNPFPFYQRIHRQTTQAALLGRLCTQLGVPRISGRVRFDNSVNISDRTELENRGVDFLIIHKDLRAEMSPSAHNVALVPNSNIPKSTMRECLEAYISLYGPPIFEDTDIVVLPVSVTSTRILGE